MTTAATVAHGLNVTALGLAAAALWGLSDFLGGLASRRAPALLIVAIAHGLSMTALILIATVTRASWPGERLALWGLLTGISGGLALIAFYRALALGEMGLTAALAGLLTAVIPVVFSFFTEGHPKATQMVGFVLAVAAIWCIAYQPGGAPHRQGLWLASLAGLGFGAFLIASKYASQGAVLWPLALSRVASASLATGLLLIAGLRDKAVSLFQLASGPALFPVRPTQGSPAVHRDGPSGGWMPVLLLAGSAGALEAVGNLLYMLATRIGRLDVAAVLSSLYPAVTILLAIWLLKERARPAQAWGMALALIAVVVISL